MNAILLILLLYLVNKRINKEVSSQDRYIYHVTNINGKGFYIVSDSSMGVTTTCISGAVLSSVFEDLNKTTLKLLPDSLRELDCNIKVIRVIPFRNNKYGLVYKPHSTVKSRTYTNKPIVV